MDICMRLLRTATLPALLGFVLLHCLAAAGLQPLQAQPVTVPAAGAAGQGQLVGALRSGGLVVLIRHSATAPGIGDPPGFRLDDCRTQRSLNDAGRGQARRIGQWFKQHGIEPTAVRASPWCRTRETALLAFERADDWPALSNLLGDRSREAESRRQVLDSIADVGPKDLQVLVSHGVTIDAFIGESLQQGEMVVVRPLRQAATAASGGSARPLLPQPVGVKEHRSRWWAACWCPSSLGCQRSMACAIVARVAMTSSESLCMVAEEPAGAIHVLVRGRVQGVGFRQMVKQSADAAQVAGWVRNLRDGRVEAVLAGSPAAVQAVLDDIGQGPRGSQVDDVITRPALAEECRAARAPLEVRRTA